MVSVLEKLVGTCTKRTKAIKMERASNELLPAPIAILLCPTRKARWTGRRHHYSRNHELSLCKDQHQPCQRNIDMTVISHYQHHLFQLSRHIRDHPVQQLQHRRHQPYRKRQLRNTLSSRQHSPKQAHLCGRSSYHLISVPHFLMWPIPTLSAIMRPVASSAGRWYRTLCSSAI